MLFSLGLSMGVIALGGFVGLISDIFLAGAFNTFWFRYIGQTVGYLFIFLSPLRASERYSRRFKGWQVFATGLLIVFLLLPPVRPTHTSAPPQPSLLPSPPPPSLVFFC